MAEQSALDRLIEVRFLEGLLIKKEMKQMNKIMARKVKKFRKDGASIRKVATLTAEEYPHLKLCKGNQIEGMILLTEAGKTLNEDCWKWSLAGSSSSKDTCPTSRLS